MRAAATFSASNRTIDQPIALGAIADLIVVLDEDHEVLTRKVGRRRATRPAEILGALALEREPLRDRARQQRRVGEVGVIAAALAGQGHVDGVVEIVRPHGVEAEPAVGARQHDATVVVV